jgi:hypothetical protein
VAASLTLVAAPVGSRADFHTDCPAIVTGHANVYLVANADGSLTYTGVLNCTTATIWIDSLTIGPPASPPFTDADPTVNEAGPCPMCLTPLVVSNTVTLPPGEYQVTMLITVLDNPPLPQSGNHIDIPRYGRWMWTGSGQPTPTCTAVAGFPNYQGSNCG